MCGKVLGNRNRSTSSFCAHKKETRPKPGLKRSLTVGGVSIPQPGFLDDVPTYAARRFLVRAPFLADRDLSAADRFAASPRADRPFGRASGSSFFPRPEPPSRRESFCSRLPKHASLLRLSARLGPHILPRYVPPDASACRSSSICLREAYQYIHAWP